MRSLTARLVRCTAALAVAVLLSSTGYAQEVVVHPFLQQATPDSIWVTWETDAEVNGTLEWGPTSDLGNTVESTPFDMVGGGILHDAQIQGLEADTRYYYRVTVGEWQSAIADFRTPPVRGAETGLRIVAMSDMQQDGSQPDKFSEIVNDGVIAWIDETYGEPLADVAGMVLLAGDLVDDGREYEDWVDQFFAPARELFAHVPVYPVPGNHEHNSHFFFDYFRLPSVGETVFNDEHWWFVDYANVRVIGLDTNDGFGLPPQANWFQATLADTCGDEDIDFVFAQFHHPAQSEMWVVGESGFSGWIVDQLEQFTEDCGKPSVHFYGHTHAYARGQSRDHQHLWINVASAGGSLDNWGEYPQIDYPETTIATDEYGFVFVDIVGGDAPEFTVTRVTRGQPDAIKDNEVQDVIRIRRDNLPPDRPRPAGPAGAGISAECATLRIESEYSDPDDDALQGVHWQVGATCDPFGDVVAERWVQASNLYHGEDTQVGIDLDEVMVDQMPPDADLCWRVRVRDEGLAWSPWSVAVPIHTGTAARSENLLVGADAEDGVDAWTSRTGAVEAVESADCEGAYTGSGDAYFAPAGQCAPVASGEAVQRVDVSAYADLIDGAGAEAHFAALGSTYAGAAEASMYLEFVGANGSDALGASEPIIFRRARWERHASDVEVPEGTRFVDVVIAATRDGEGDGGYVDDLVLTVAAAGSVDCAASGDGVVPPDPVDADPDPDAGPDVDADAGLDVPVDAVPDAGPDAEEDGSGMADTGGDAGGDVGSEGPRRKGGCSASGALYGGWFGLVALVAVRRRRRV